MPVKEKIFPELIEPTVGSSFTIRKFSRQFSKNRSHWHAHPEYELVYISNGNGNRHIANSLTSYKDGDLIFLGPNLPHLGFSEDLDIEHTEIVIQMAKGFLGQPFINLPEYKDIADLLKRVQNGVSFRGKFKHEIGKEMIAMVDMEPMPRLLKLLEILHKMAVSTSYRLLHAEHMNFNVDSIEGDRMRQVSNFIKDKYQEPLVVSDVAEEVGMTVPAFCRYFKKVSKKTFNQFLNEYRIGHARRMIRKSNYTLASIAMECGFSNISNFNKQFKRISGETPSEFRKRHIQVVEAD